MLGRLLERTRTSHVHRKRGRLMRVPSHGPVTGCIAESASFHASCACTHAKPGLASSGFRASLLGRPKHCRNRYLAYVPNHRPQGTDDFPSTRHTNLVAAHRVTGRFHADSALPVFVNDKYPVLTSVRYAALPSILAVLS